MWSRVVEFMLGCWLAVSPFVFQHGDDAWLWAVDFTAALAVMLLALLSYWRPARHAHLGTALVALALILLGRLSRVGEVAPASQNHILAGLLLLMFSLVPNHASQPPRSWYPRQRQSFPKA